MTIFYSPSRNGFFDDAVGYTTLPDDLIEVTPEQHMEIINQVNLNGKKIVVKDGIISFDEQESNATWAFVRKRRNRMLNASDYTQVPDWPGDKKAWSEYRQQLRDITKNFKDPNSVVWPKAPK